MTRHVVRVIRLETTIALMRMKGFGGAADAQNDIGKLLLRKRTHTGDVSTTPTILSTTGRLMNP